MQAIVAHGWIRGGTGWIRGGTGVDACPSGFTQITADAAECAAGSTALGLTYNAGENEAGPNAVCNWCGGCVPQITRLSSNHGTAAKWVCKPTVSAFRLVKGKVNWATCASRRGGVEWSGGVEGPAACTDLSRHIRHIHPPNPLLPPFPPPYTLAFSARRAFRPRSIQGLTLPTRLGKVSR